MNQWVNVSDPFHFDKAAAACFDKCSSFVLVACRFFVAWMICFSVRLM
jgi:hypothetical protein